MDVKLFWIVVFVLASGLASATWSVEGVNICNERRVGERMCPELFILGVQKGGTTSLFSWLMEKHPQIKVWNGAGKEAHFFHNDVRYSRGLVFYSSKFPKRHSHTDVAMEGTPNYFGNVRVPMRMKMKLNIPYLRFIVSLKDPAQRAWSWYKHSQAIMASKRETMDCAYKAHENKFSRMVEDVAPKLRDCIERYPVEKSFAQCAHDSGTWGPVRQEYCSNSKTQPWNIWMFSAGLYGPMLDFWLQHFSSEQFCIVAYDDLVYNLPSVESQLKPCLAFHGIDFNISPHESLPRVTLMPSELENCQRCEQLQPEELHQLSGKLHDTLYTKSNEHLRNLMRSHYGRDFPIWEDTYKSQYPHFQQDDDLETYMHTH